MFNARDVSVTSWYWVVTWGWRVVQLTRQLSSGGRHGASTRSSRWSVISSQWWPPTHAPQSGAGNVTVQASSTLQMNINCLNFCEELWSSGTAKKTIGISGIHIMRNFTTFTVSYLRMIALLDMKGGTTPGESTKDGEGESSPMGEFLYTPYLNGSKSMGCFSRSTWTMRTEGW